MPGIESRFGAIIVASAMACVCSLGGAAHASAEWGLNGTYTATSNGEWAQTNDVYRDESSVRSTWRITTTCSDPANCTGTVTTDWGWSAPIYQKAGLWVVKRALVGWEPCADGSAADGLQIYTFYPATPDGHAVDASSTTLLGQDQATGVSGGCGINRQLQITMPFKLVKVDAAAQ